MVSLRAMIPTYDREGMLWERLARAAAPLNLQYAAPHYDIAICHNEGYQDENMDVEIQRSVSGLQPDVGELHFKIVEPVLAATLIYQGAYDWLPEANARVATWIAANHFDYVCPMFNIYHVSPQTEPEAGKMITEVCYPVRRTPGSAAG